MKIKTDTYLKNNEINEHKPSRNKDFDNKTNIDVKCINRMNQQTYFYIFIFTTSIELLAY